MRGVKAHAEIGGASRWGLEVIKLGKRISSELGVPLYIHLGQLWPVKDGATIDPDEVVRGLMPLMEPGDVLAHPFTRHPGGFVSAATGEVHPVVWAALERGVTVDVGHGSHFSFEMARRTLAAGIRPHTLGADMHGYNVRVPGEGDTAGSGQSVLRRRTVQPDPRDDRIDDAGHPAARSRSRRSPAIPRRMLKWRTVSARCSLDERLIFPCSISCTAASRCPTTAAKAIIAPMMLRPVLALRAGRMVEADCPLNCLPIPAGSLSSNREKAMSPVQPPRRTPGTFLYSEAVTTLQGLSADIAFLGVPYGQAYSYEDITNDQSNAPTAMRDASARIVRSLERYDFDLGGALYDGQPIRAVDCGDSDRTRRSGSAFALYRASGASHPAAGALPIVLGGDHGVPIPVLRAFDAMGRSR